MSDTDTTTDTGTTEPTNDGGNDSGFTPPATQAELNKIVSERIARERAKYADYKDLQDKAAKFDELEQANKSEVEKANERLAAAERERDQARTEGLKLRVAAKHGISDEDADLFLTGTDEDTLTKQAQRLAAREADRKKQGNHVPGEGTTPAPVTTEDGAFARQLLSGD